MFCPAKKLAAEAVFVKVIVGTTRHSSPSSVGRNRPGPIRSRLRRPAFRGGDARGFNHRRQRFKNIVQTPRGYEGREYQLLNPMTSRPRGCPRSAHPERTSESQEYS